MNDKQKRALGVGGVAVGGLLAYRHLHSGKGRAAGGTMTNGLAQASSLTGSTTPFVPQAPIVVPAGESIYDPNSQGLLTTPTVPTQQATTPGGPAYVVNVSTPRTHGTTRNHRRAVTRPHNGGKKKKKGKVTK